MKMRKQELIAYNGTLSAINTPIIHNQAALSIVH